MLKSILKLRLIQIYRAIKEIGLFRIFILVAITIIVLFVLFSELSNSNNVFYISVGYFFVIFFIHIKRSDKIFLKIYSEKYKVIFFIEYLILSIPLTIGLAINNFIIIPIYILAILISVNIEINLKKSSRNSQIQNLIPNSCFEWKAGIRKNFIAFFAIWIIALVFSFFVGTVPIAILIFAILQIQFYEKGEDLQILLASQLSEKKFIFKKIKTQVTLFSILVLPLAFAFLLFHYKLWYIVVVEYFITVSLQMFFVILKYAFYKPNEKPAAMQIYSSIGMAGMFIPFLLPVVWVLTIYIYFKSLKKLKFYLNDFN